MADLQKEIPEVKEENIEEADIKEEPRTVVNPDAGFTSGPMETNLIKIEEYWQDGLEEEDVTPYVNRRDSDWQVTIGKEPADAISIKVECSIGKKDVAAELAGLSCESVSSGLGKDMCERTYAGRGDWTEVGADQAVTLKEEPEDDFIECLKTEPLETAPPRRIVEVEKLYHCAFCDYRCTHENTLKAHIRTHTGEKPFACKLCDHSSARLSHLNLHMRIHTGEKPFACQLCGQCFAQSSHLKTHTRIHTGEKLFVCKLCDHSSARLSHMKMHMTTHNRRKH